MSSPHCSRPSRTSASPRLKGSQAWWEGAPKASPSPHPLLDSSGCFGVEGPCSHRCGQDRLFRPHAVTRCHRGGGGGNQTSPVVAARRCPSPALSLPWLLGTHTHQSAQFAPGRAIQSAICQRSLCLQLRAEGRSRKVSRPLYSSEQEETKGLGWMRCFRQVFPIMVIDSLSSLSVGAERAQLSPSTSAFNTGGVARPQPLLTGQHCQI